MIPVMLQRWHAISFFHWSCAAALIQKRLPSGLEVDTFDERAWVSLTPFLLVGLRPPLLPRSFGMSFPETNLRTYVRGSAGAGIWFFSLDAARYSAVIGARLTYGLPYYLARMQVQNGDREVLYTSKRGNDAAARIRIEKGSRIEQPSTLDRFLTERYRLYSVRQSTLLTAQIAHRPWQLHRGRVLEFEESVRRAADVETPSPEFLFHHSPGVDARIGRPYQPPSSH